MNSNPSLVSHRAPLPVWQRVAHKLHRLVADRTARRQLAMMSEEMLQDIGLRHNDIERAFLNSPWREVDWEELNRIRGDKGCARYV